jgi:hypothetical protein
MVFGMLKYIRRLFAISFFFLFFGPTIDYMNQHLLEVPLEGYPYELAKGAIFLATSLSVFFLNNLFIINHDEYKSKLGVDYEKTI